MSNTNLNAQEGRVMHTYMKQILIFIAIVVALLGVIRSTFAEDNGRIQEEKKRIQKFNYQAANSIGKYRFPLTVNSFFKDLGQPDSTFTDDNMTCPVGQYHTWCLQSQNLKILVLGDHYEPDVNYSAESRLFGIAKCEQGKDTGYNGLWGIKLGDSDKQVRDYLFRIVKKNKGSNLKTNIKGRPIHVILNSYTVSHHHTLEKGGLYFYFIINKEGKLDVIIQSSFDLSIVC